ncbi:N-acetylglucosamine kinase [Marinimicrobium sp. C2-29]|uniref:N-acetylglucosamine kinase n=1 Tax=Marinimicrobium sp. C2-29 TaxID=3139825 RepID=UPI0031386747
MVSAPGEEHYYLGIDGGGTKCKACIATADGRVLGTALAGPANPLHGFEQTLDSIECAARRALKDAQLPPETLQHLIAGVGLAGVNVPDLYRSISEWRHPFDHLYLATDLGIANMGAHHSEDGAVIVVGTGSSGYARVNGVERLLGGHGFPYGDQGSGAWMGLEAIKAVLLASDQLGPPTNLTEGVARLLGAKGIAIVEVMSGRPSSEYAKLAPLVFSAAEEGDDVAQKIVEEGASYISSMAYKLLDCQPGRLSLIGGLAARIEGWLAPGILKDLSIPLGPPEEGAILFARQRHLKANIA